MLFFVVDVVASSKKTSSKKGYLHGSHLCYEELNCSSIFVLKLQRPFSSTGQKKCTIFTRCFYLQKKESLS